MDIVRRLTLNTYVHLGRTIANAMKMKLSGMIAY